jgi:hypothetical protein
MPSHPYVHNLQLQFCHRNSQAKMRTPITRDEPRQACPRWNRIGHDSTDYGVGLPAHKRWLVACQNASSSMNNLGLSDRRACSGPGEGGCVQPYSIRYNLCKYDPTRKAQPGHQGPLTSVSSRLLRIFGIPTAIDFNTISRFFEILFWLTVWAIYTSQ